MSATHLYRQSKIGDSLVEALDALVDSGKLPGNLALRIMQEVGSELDLFAIDRPPFFPPSLPFSHSYSPTHPSLLLQFDKAIITALEEDVTAKSTFKGQLDVYRYCDNVSARWGVSVFIHLLLLFSFQLT